MRFWAFFEIWFWAFFEILTNFQPILNPSVSHRWAYLDDLSCVSIRRGVVVAVRRRHTVNFASFGHILALLHSTRRFNCRQLRRLWIEAIGFVPMCLSPGKLIGEVKFCESFTLWTIWIVYNGRGGVAGRETWYLTNRSWRASQVSEVRGKLQKLRGYWRILGEVWLFSTESSTWVTIY